MSELMKKYREQTIDASRNIFRSQDIIHKEKSILDNLNVIESYFQQQLTIFRKQFSSFLINFTDSSYDKIVSIHFIFSSNGYSFYCSDFSFDFSISPKKDLSFSKELKQSFENEEQYQQIKHAESLFLNIDMNIVKLFYDTLNQIKQYCEETSNIFKNDFESKVNIIQKFFIKEHPLKEWRKKYIKSDFGGIYLSFDKEENRATIHHYNFKYNQYKEQLERNQYKVTYKEAKAYVDKNIVFNDTLILNTSKLNELLPIFQLIEVERKRYKGTPYKEKIYACDIDLLLQFVNAACF